MKPMRKILMTGLLAGTLLLPAGMALANPVDHMEPPNWWTGFKDRNLQIMLHGKDISGYHVVLLKADGIAQLRGTARTENPDYLFLNLSVDENGKAGMITFAFQKNGKTEFTEDYRIKVRAPGSANRDGFDNSDTIYLITPDRFANGDTKNDNVAGYPDPLNRKDDYGRHGGDIEGIREHLDYIAGLGMTQIWLNPILENNMPEQSYHGYAATDLYKIDPRYGTMDEFLEFAKEAKAKGLGLIWDAVPNHVGSNHWWMKDLPASDWINNGGKFVQNSHQHEAIQNPYAADVDKKAFSDGWFVSAMPDLNQRNPLLANYLIENSIWWIETAGLSGLRIDTYPYSDTEFTGKWLDRLVLEYPDLNTVGEEWRLNPKVVAHWQRGPNHKSDGEPLSRSMMDFPLQDALRHGITDEDNWDKGLIAFYDMLSNDSLYADPYNLTIFTTNHDMDRTAKQFGDDPQLIRMAYGVLFTMRGTPQFYYGDEVLATNKKGGDHGEIRSEMPGGWPDSKVNAFTGKGLRQEQREMQDYVRKLANWRKTSTAVQTGKMIMYAPQVGWGPSPAQHLLTYFRFNDHETVMVVVNKNDQPTGLPLTKYADHIGSAKSATNVITGKVSDLSRGLVIPARTTAIFELQD